MQRNHQASALLRACRQVPDWWTVGGRNNPYAIEFVGLGATAQFYSKAGTYTGDDTVVLWLKPTATIANGVAYGVFSIYSSSLGHDLWSLRLEGDTANGNTLNLYVFGSSVGKVLNIGTGWSCIMIEWVAGTPTMYRNGVLQFVSSAGSTTPCDRTPSVMQTRRLTVSPMFVRTSSSLTRWPSSHSADSIRDLQFGPAVGLRQRLRGAGCFLRGGERLRLYYGR